MCTLTLTYDKNNAEARQALAALLRTGFFTELSSSDDDSAAVIDYSDPWLYEDHGDLPQLPADKESYTPEEALNLILEDVRQIYRDNNAI
ncbi:MAG: hypothetical protein IJ176_04465 [Prevotella sp.]|nr:hypothetical protein [Prevotella sp.]